MDLEVSLHLHAEVRHLAQEDHISHLGAHFQSLLVHVPVLDHQTKDHQK
jgi:hypothetical protein